MPLRGGELMLRRLLLLLLLGASPAWASDQVIMGGGNMSMTATTTEYLPIMGSENELWGTSEASEEGLVSTGGTLKTLHVWLDAAPDNGAGTQTYTFTLRKNTAGCNVTCNISETATSCEDTSNTCAVVANDAVTMQKTIGAGTPTVTEARWALIFSSTTAKESLLIGTGGSGSNAANRYIPPHGMADPQQTAADNSALLVTTGGTLKNLYIEVQAVPGGTAERVYTLIKNEFTATALTCTITAAITACSDTVNTVAAVAGDFFSIENNPNGTPASGSNRAAVGMTFLADTDGEFLISTDVGSPDNTTTTYGIVQAGKMGATTTEASHWTRALAMSILHIRAHWANPPGVGKQWVYTLRQDSVGGTLDNALDNTLLLCTKSVGDENCNGTSTITIPDDDILTVSIVPTGTPTANITQIGLLGFIAPASGGQAAVIRDAILQGCVCD